MEKFRKIAVIAVFALVIFGLAIAHAFVPDKELSTAERRKLSKPPQLTAEGVFNGKYFSSLESYLLDQFPLRDGFRSVKAVANYDVFGIRDNNDVYLVGDSIMRLEYPLRENQIKIAIDKIEGIINSHPELGKAYFSIIPDKNYFMALKNGYPSMDYEKLFGLMEEGVVSAEYINIVNELSLDNYYRTDSHWRQESILPVVQRLCEAMGVPAGELSDYEQHELSPFYGVYAGQAAVPVKPESIVYLTSDATENALVQSVEHQEPMDVYTLSDFEGMDPYDIYLSGAEAVITIENPSAKTDKELIIFRDSFGSSISPLFIDSYAKITLIDLRYISSALIDDYVSFENADVLFLYSTMLLNSAGILK